MKYEWPANTSPHLHTHLLPRYPEDPRPGQPFPFPPPANDEPQIAEERFRAEVAGLRERLEKR